MSSISLHKQALAKTQVAGFLSSHLIPFTFRNDTKNVKFILDRHSLTPDPNNTRK